ncbi:DEAD/DEAH box helicase [Nocardia jejuensis]|uniref:DEAD/DEAH box helicase n=1 Tax=Nocardia jejuensis TaxID=328049 RepID=UPI00082F0376|nr:DEAD/DEAH box helicase [Nocardia jejuensis]
MGTFIELFDVLDTRAAVRGKQFEHLCQWWLTNDPTYKAVLRRVWLWDDWDGWWAADAGIDLVAEDCDGKLWAIQAKAYSSDRAVTKDDVNKFLAESSRATFSFRLLIATTDKLHHIARRTINDQEKHVSFVGLSDLLTSEVDWPSDPGDLRPSPTRNPATPRDYQQEAIDNVVLGFETADRGQLLMACGTGKTLTSLFIKETLDPKRTLVLLPSLSLLKQTMQVWQTHKTKAFVALPVCSDATVAQNADEAVMHTSELGVPVTTEPAQIAAFLRQQSGPCVVFSTYQSSPRIAAAFASEQLPVFDLVVADEAHRIAGDKSSVFATVLDADAIKAHRRLFMTATPRYHTGRVRKAASEAELEVASMDDPTRFGEVLHRLSFGEAISRKLLTDYQVVVVGVDDATYQQWVERGKLVVRGGKSTNARTLAGQIGLAKAMRKYDLRRIISFHSRVAGAREFAAEMSEVIDWMPPAQRPTGMLWTGYVSGEMTAGERHLKLRQLRQCEEGERGLLANARCLSEGIDVPTLDGVAFVDPRRGEVDIVQAVGRAIRLASDKTVGTIVLPVFIDTETDPESALDDSSFKPVWDVINALRAHDEDLAEQIDSMRRELGRTGGLARIPEKIHLDVSTRVSASFAKAFDVRLVEKTSARWEFWCGLLGKYAGENGTARVPVDLVVEGFPLGQWASVQRRQYAKGTLSEDRREKLESLPGWSWDVLSDQWDVWIRLMNEFVAEHGHANVPFPYRVGEFNLRSWVATQRGLFRRGRLSEGRIRELGALPGWLWDVHEDLWQQNYSALQQFAERLGHSRTPPGHMENGLNLGTWVVVQRRTREEMSPERRALLEALLGWSWDPLADRWEASYAELVKFTKREGHARVPISHCENNLPLGKWVTHQRSRRDKLTVEQRTRLETLPGWNWDVRSDMWHRKFALLQQFQRREGHALVPQGHVEDHIKLGSWVNEQRSRREEISAERRELLESVPGWAWDPHTAAWDRGYCELVEFVDRKGHARVPAGHIEGKVKLGVWVGEQRANRETMSQDRRARLEAISGWSWNSVEDSWMESLEQLRVFAAREGHTNVPVDHSENGLKLGQWTRLRRSEHLKLTPQRKALLEAIPGWFWGTKQDYIWSQKLGLLEKFVAREGHSRVPDGYVHDGVKLGGWVREQRAERSKLSAERRSKLEVLPGWTWNLFQDVWGERYEMVEKFAAREGHSRVPQGHFEDGVALGSWVAVQRQKQQALTPEQRAQLEKLPGWVWSPHDAKWDSMYELVRQYLEEHGTTRLPYDRTYKGAKLGNWVSLQRNNYAKGKLSAERRHRLEEIVGWEWKLS